MVHSVGIVAADRSFVACAQDLAALLEVAGHSVVFAPRWRTTPVGTFAVVTGADNEGRESLAEPDVFVFVGGDAPPRADVLAARAEGQRVVIGGRYTSTAAMLALMPDEG